MVDTCHVTGTLIAPDGSPLPRVTALFHRLPERAFVAGDSTAMPHVVRHVTSGTGAVSVHLVPGPYLVRPQGASYPAFRIDVPDEPTARLEDIQDDILQPPPSRIIEAVDEAREARDQAVSYRDDAAHSAQAAADAAQAAAGSEQSVADNAAAAEQARDEAQGAAGTATDAASDAVQAAEEAEQTTRVAVDLASEPAQPPGEFEGNVPDAIWGITDKDGQIILGLDGEGFPLTRWGAEFHGNADLPDYNYVDRNGTVIQGWQEDGTFVIGGGGGGGADPALEGRVEALEQQVPLKADQATISQSLADMQQDVDEAVALAEALGVAQQFGFAVYPSANDGLEDTTDGDYFAVSEDDSPVFQTLYRNDSGSAVVVNDVPSLKHMPTAERDVPKGRLWVRGATPYVARPLSNIPSVVIDHAGVYSLFDSLAADHQGYVTREEVGQDVADNPIYEYVFAPPGASLAGWAEEDAAPPKIVLVGGTHGHEKRAVITNYLLMRDICNNWREVAGAEELRFSCAFVVIPCLNPSGVDLSQRQNANGVDVNRNLPTGWETGGSSNPESNTYRGPSPLSEPEAQVAHDLPSRHPDACMMIDHHNGAASVSNSRAWIGVSRPEDVGLATGVLAHHTAYVRRELPEFDSQPDPIVHLSQSSDGTVARDWAAAGVGAALLETPGASQFPSDSESFRNNLSALRQLVYAAYRRESLRRLLTGA